MQEMLCVMAVEFLVTLIANFVNKYVKIKNVVFCYILNIYSTYKTIYVQKYFDPSATP